LKRYERVRKSEKEDESNQTSSALLKVFLLANLLRKRIYVSGAYQESIRVISGALENPEMIKQEVPPPEKSREKMAALQDMGPSA
jgi:hypothetical protein